MKVFWDTSAAINALVSAQVFRRLDSDEHFARIHLLSEFFSIITGKGIEVRDQAGQLARLLLQPKDAAIWLRTFVGKVSFVELDWSETLDALDKAQALSVQGARVYDYAHALAAIKSGADVVLTRNEKDFTGLTGNVRVEWP